MIENDDFLERLRADARQLQYEGDDATWTRLRARVRAGIAAQPTVAQLLAEWFRPIVMSLAALSIVAALGTAWYVQHPEPVTIDSIAASNSVEISVGGDTYSVPN